MCTILSGCDSCGLKGFFCQLIGLVIDDLLCFDDSNGDFIYNSIIPFLSTMDTNVKNHCYFILTRLMLSEKTVQREHFNQS